MTDADNAKRTKKPIWHNVRSLFVAFLLFLGVFSAVIAAFPRDAKAICCTGCPDVGGAMNYIYQAHQDLRKRVQDEWDDDLAAYENWLIKFINEEVAVAAALMSTQMSAVAMYYTQIIGTFLDAQTQLETQRVFRKLQYEAHRDYTPSETFCYFGTNTRSLAGSEEKGRLNALILSSMSLRRQMGNVHVAGSIDAVDDHRVRWDQFVKTYCDPLDNNFQDEVAKASGFFVPTSPLNLGTGQVRTGLVLACDHDGSGSGNDIGGEDANRYNRDINYTKLIEKPRTLEIDLSDNTLNSSITPVSSLYGGVYDQPGDEEDIIAMSKNLYGHNVLSRRLASATITRSDAKRLYLALRSVAAKRNVAQASYNAIVALKSAGTTHEMTGFSAASLIYGTPPANPLLLPSQSRRFLAAIINQLLPADPTLTASNIFSLIGYSPSYFAQLEILSKRIYQNPSFYADLYETPANVTRKKVAMKAIELMVDRAIYESQIRREMSISVLLASKLRALNREANKGVITAVGQER